MSNRHLNNTTKLVHNITKYQNLVDQLKNSCTAIKTANNIPHDD